MSNKKKKSQFQKDRDESFKRVYGTNKTGLSVLELPEFSLEAFTKKRDFQLVINKTGHFSLDEKRALIFHWATKGTFQEMKTFQMAYAEGLAQKKMIQLEWEDHSKEKLSRKRTPREILEQFLCHANVPSILRNQIDPSLKKATVEELEKFRSDIIDGKVPLFDMETRSLNLIETAIETKKRRSLDNQLKTQTNPKKQTKLEKLKKYVR